MIIIGKAEKGDFAAIFDLIKRCDLPLEGLNDHLNTSLVAKEGQIVIGNVTLEIYGQYALLRSLAVEPAKRGYSLGKRLVRASLELARAYGVRQVYLLTNTAHDFFARFYAFRDVTRAEVPEAVKQSVEFVGACPVGTPVMMLDLQPSSCCAGTKSADLIHSDVREYYAERARKSTSCCVDSKAGNDLYQFNMLEEIPDEVANFSLGCGDPVTLADLHPGETVLDLGSGGGLDCFLAAKRVGKSGLVIGVDMTPEMLERARSAARRLKVENVSFRQGYLEALPVEDGVVDVIISNCVVNLSPDKPTVFAEMFRVLKPGGRVAVNDLVKTRDLPEKVQQDMRAWASCASGALKVTEIEQGLREAGFININVAPMEKNLEMPIEIPVDALISARITACKP
jgi:N-acetylglutamate synthase-like GNAT family acetyltransferase/SAM-dependent methyltransferase